MDAAPAGLADESSSTSVRGYLKKDPIDYMRKGKTLQLELLLLDRDYFKSWVFQKIAQPIDTPGSWWLPRDRDDEYMRGILS
ncbi:MAG: hypothetical protein ACLQNV_20515 [Steroidobacteraceae bacterium]